MRAIFNIFFIIIDYYSKRNMRVFIRSFMETAMRLIIILSLSDRGHAIKKKISLDVCMRYITVTCHGINRMT